MAFYDRHSFDQVRTVLPTTHRIRIFNAKGCDIRDSYQYKKELISDYKIWSNSDGQVSRDRDHPVHSTRVEYASHEENDSTSAAESFYNRKDSTRVEFENDSGSGSSFVAESAAAYCVSINRGRLAPEFWSVIKLNQKSITYYSYRS